MLSNDSLSIDHMLSSSQVFSLNNTLFTTILLLSLYSILFYLPFSYSIQSVFSRLQATGCPLPVGSYFLHAVSLIPNFAFDHRYHDALLIPCHVLCISLLLPTLNYRYLLVTVSLLLIRSGVETNPGPSWQKPTTDNLRAMHLNARSLRNKIHFVEAESEKFDIITVSETWFREASASRITNFHPPIKRDRPDDAGYGGVAIYVRNTLYCKPRPDLQVPDLEAVWVETKLNQESLLIGSFYRPPDARVDYWKLISDSIAKANNTGLKFVILGDFNTDWLSSPSQHLIDILDIFQLTQLVNEPTRITDNTSTCIALVIVQSPFLISHIEVLPEICSDHRVPCAYIKNCIPKDKPFKRTIYNYKKLDQNKFNNLLSDTNRI